MTKLKLIISFSIIIIIGIILFCLTTLKNNTTDQRFTDPNLVGYWKGESEENPGFEIDNNYIISNDEKSPYEINKDGDIIIHYSSFIIKGKYKVENNKLFIISNNNIDSYSRWCEEKKDIC